MKEPFKNKKMYQYLQQLIASNILKLCCFKRKRELAEISCVRTGESWYLTDNGRGDVGRKLRLWWLRVCRGVLRPLSIHPASCWTRAQSGLELLCLVLGFQ